MRGASGLAWDVRRWRAVVRFFKQLAEAHAGLDHGVWLKRCQGSSLQEDRGEEIRNSVGALSVIAKGYIHSTFFKSSLENEQSLKMINKPILFVLSVPRPLTRAMIPYLFHSKVE